MEEINQILSSNGRRLSKTSISRRSITSRGSISALSTLSVYKFNNQNIPKDILTTLSENGADKKVLKQLDRFIRKQEHDHVYNNINREIKYQMFI